MIDYGSDLLQLLHAGER